MSDVNSVFRNSWVRKLDTNALQTVSSSRVQQTQGSDLASPTAIDKRVGARVAAAREAAGVSKAEAAHLLNLPAKSYDRLESGIDRISAEQMKRLADRFSHPASAFLADHSTRVTENTVGALSVLLCDRINEALAKSMGMTGESASGLIMVGSNEFQPIADLSGLLGLTHSAAVRLVARLQNAGWLTKTRGTDRRQVLLSLTPAGVRKRRGLLAARSKAISKLLRTLTDDEQAVLAQIGRKLLACHTSIGANGHPCRLCEAGACQGQADCPMNVTQYSQ